MSVPRPRTDLPTIEDDTRPFWDAAKEGRFLVRRCNACGEVHHYPRPFCPGCWSDDVEWLEASGRATLYTWSTVYVNDLPPFAERLPYIAAVVDLAEGPRVMTNLVECDGVELAIGMPVEVRYEPLDEQITVPVFAPSPSGG
jgi:uncharacterized OB-fold protein